MRLASSDRREVVARLLVIFPASFFLAMLAGGQSPEKDGSISRTETRAVPAAVAPGAAEKGDLRLGKLRVGKILFLGNSVTRHGPAPDIGWLGDWGMAASAPEKDFVHLLVDRIAEEAGGKPEVMVANIADFERHPAEFNPAVGLKDALAFRPDLVIFAIGANVPALTTDEAKAGFRDGCSGLFARLKQECSPALFVRGEFWLDPVKDGLMKDACREAGGIYVDLGNPAAVEANLARSERKFEHAGVAGHPGDRGMRILTDALWKAVQEGAKAAD